MGENKTLIGLWVIYLQYQRMFCRKRNGGKTKIKIVIWYVGSKVSIY